MFEKLRAKTGYELYITAGLKAVLNGQWESLQPKMTYSIVRPLMCSWLRSIDIIGHCPATFYEGLHFGPPMPVNRRPISDRAVCLSVCSIV